VAWQGADRVTPEPPPSEFRTHRVCGAHFVPRRAERVKVSSMPLPRPLLFIALFALACGENKGGAKIGATVGDGAAGPSGQGGGPPGSRGGGSGVFGGGNDPDAASVPDGDILAGDVSADPADARPDLGRDLARDTSFTPVDAVTLADAGPGADLSSDPCAGICQTYETEYAAALARARSCNPGLKLQCQMTATSNLKCGGCKIWVTSTVELTGIRMKWADAGCQTCKVLCPAIACRALTTGVCHSKMLAAQDPPGGQILPPTVMGTCSDQADPVPF
jgi:hypothetical protein